MKEHEIVITALTGIGLAYLIWYIQQQTQNSMPTPEAQAEAQFGGLSLKAGLSTNAGTPLHNTHTTHGWHPGFDPDPSAQPVIESKVRYPVVPGGNVSNVIHHGWSSVGKNSPAGNDWRLNPPEVAVI